MKYIDRLLQAAPVEWCTLGEVAEYEQPTKYLVKSTNYKDSFPTPVLTAGKSFILGYTDEIDGIYKASESPVIIFDDFTTANKWVDFDFKAKSSAMKMITSKDPSKFSLRYIYHWLNTLPSGLVESDHKRQWISNYSKKKIPIPPVAVQEEVVRVLDKFTALEAELEAELDCRKRQYQYYRDALLTFDLSPSDGLCYSPLFPAPFAVEWLPLGEVFEMRNGYTPSKSNPAYWEGGTIPWFRMEDLRTSGRILEDSIQHITLEAVKGKGLFKAGSILMATTATIGEHALLVTDSLANQRFTNFEIHESLLGAITPMFAYYYFFLICEWCKRNVYESSFPSVDMKSLREVHFPIPPLAVQERIVEILDKFDTLVNSISEGLPREIELRRKQYEYYRDALLSFEPQTSNF